MPAARPLLVYDGDCPFCLEWVRRWRSVTGDRVRYAPYQQVAAELPRIPAADFARAVQYVAADGQVLSGAAASLRTLAHAPGRGASWWCYRRLPGAAWVCEQAYAAVARHRGAAFRVSRWLWGAEPTLPTHALAVRLFLAALALVNLAAFGSLGGQIGGLAGSHGILPLVDYLAQAAQRFPGAERYWLFPTLFWLDSGDAALQAACAAGVAASALLLFDRWRRSALGVLFVAYLSLFYAGQVFLEFQWDLLLLEADALAFALCRRPELLAWAVRWLVFRFMLMSGLVKWQGDAAWRDFSVLRHHFWTQPLPSPLAWHAARLPTGVLAAGAVATLAVELVVPFALLLPRRPRQWAAWAVIAFQLGIVLTGNYGFFNLLVLTLCIALFDDAALARCLRWWPRRTPPRASPAPTGWRAAPAGVVAAASVVLGLAQTAATALGDATPAALTAMNEALLPLHVVNAYGPFRTMTVERPEITVEGTLDGTHWVAYPFAHKPGDVRRAPHWTIPGQPRLDWQMWFAALGTQQDQPWFRQFVRALLRREAPVLALLERDPFAGQAPVAVRALLDAYRPADAAAHAAGAWWVRQPSGLYLPPVRLDGEGRLIAADAP